MSITLLLFLLGLVIMIISGNKFVDSATFIAKKTGMSALLIGATVVSLATTIPELTVSILSVINGVTDIAVGNAIGSTICNTSFIAGIVLSSLKIKVDRGFKLRGGFLIGTFVVMILFSLDSRVQVWEGMVLLLIMTGYFAFNVKQSKGQSTTEEHLKEEVDQSFLSIFIVFIISVLGVILGSQLLITHGVTIAEGLGVPEAVIALTMIAIGTSLPELVTAVSSILKKNGGLSVGNVLGANVLNITLILGICAVISSGGLPLTNTNVLGKPFPMTLLIDLPLALVATLLFVVPPMIKGRTYRWQGFVLLALYATYLTFLFTSVA